MPSWVTAEAANKVPTGEKLRATEDQKVVFTYDFYLLLFSFFFLLFFFWGGGGGALPAQSASLFSSPLQTSSKLCIRNSEPDFNVWFGYFSFVKVFVRKWKICPCFQWTE